MMKVYVRGVQGEYLIAKSDQEASTLLTSVDVYEYQVKSSQRNKKCDASGKSHLNAKLSSTCPM